MAGAGGVRVTTRGTEKRREQGQLVRRVKRERECESSTCTQENYDNVSQLWSDLRISNFDGTIATDLKLANIIAGIMSSSSLYACT